MFYPFLRKMWESVDINAVFRLTSSSSKCKLSNDFTTFLVNVRGNQTGNQELEMTTQRHRTLKI